MVKIKKNYGSCFVCTVSPAHTSDVTLHKFPSKAKRRSQWLQTIGLSPVNYKPSYRICSNHFSKDCYHKNSTKRVLIKGSVPTIFPNGTNLVNYHPANNNGDTTATSSEVATGHLAPNFECPPNQACQICLSGEPYSDTVQNHQLENQLAEEQQANTYVDDEDFDDNMNVIHHD